MMKRTIIVVALGFWLFVTESMAGEKQRYFTGIPRIDLFSVTIRLPQDSIAVLTEISDSFERQQKSPWLAGGLSLALPGAGEFYSESYVKSAIFLAAEIAGWIVAYSFDKKGDNQTDFFQNFANVYWSVVDYANYLGVRVDTNSSLPPWQRVNWDTLNNYERRRGIGFTHTLPPYGTQQYYELIGKYDQYSPGWDDYTGAVTTQGVPIPTQKFLDYAQMRGKANDYYNIASTAVSVIVVNHVISALDAYFTTKSFNKSFQADARMNLRHTPFGPVAETVGTVRVTF
jgi:hypothetical protein